MSDSVAKYLRFTYSRLLPNRFADYSNLVTPDVLMIRPSGKPFKDVEERLEEAEQYVKMTKHNLWKIHTPATFLSENVAVVNYWVEQEFTYKENHTHDVALHTAVLERASRANDPLGMQWKMVLFQRCDGDDGPAGAPPRTEFVELTRSQLQSSTAFVNDDTGSFQHPGSFTRAEVAQVHAFVASVLNQVLDGEPNQSRPSLAPDFKLVLPTGQMLQGMDLGRARDLATKRELLEEPFFVRPLAGDKSKMLVVFLVRESTAAQIEIRLHSAVVEQRDRDRTFVLRHMHQGPPFGEGAYIDSMKLVLQRWVSKTSEGADGALPRRPPTMIEIKPTDKTGETLPGYIDGLIKKNKCLVFSKKFCPFCKTVKAALTASGAKFAVLELEGEAHGHVWPCAGTRRAIHGTPLVPNPNEYMEYVKSKCGSTSVPKVWIGGELVGGGDDDAADKVFADSTKLAELLRDAEAIPELRKPRFGKVGKVKPEQKGLNFYLKCVTTAEAVEGGNVSESLCGDDTGSIILSLRSDGHMALCKAGTSIRVQNAHVRMAKGQIRLVVDKWSALKAAESVEFDTVDEENNVSAVEYELK